MGGIIDGIFQFASDAANPCLAWGQRFNRAGTAALFGMVAGAAGALVFGLLAWATAPAWLTIAAGFYAGYQVSKWLTPHKEKLFAREPQFFGG